MSDKEKLKWAYKVIRSVLFVAVCFIVFIYLSLYIALSVPSVENEIRKIAETELSKLTGGDLKIGKLDIYPFNEVIIENVTLREPTGGAECISIEKVGAGISIWNLLRHQKIIITYAELIGIDAKLRQDAENAPLNIQFLIDAFSPKDKNRPPAKFDLQIGNIVIRKGSVTYNRTWLPDESDSRFDINHISLSSINADIALPRLSNNYICIDLRRLAFILDHKLDVKQISAKADIINKDVSVKDLKIYFPNTQISLSDIFLPLSKYSDFKALINSESLEIGIRIDNAYPSEFAIFYPPLARIEESFNVDLKAVVNNKYLNLNQLKVESNEGDFLLTLSDVEVSSDEYQKVKSGSNPKTYFGKNPESERKAGISTSNSGFPEIIVGEMILKSNEKFNLSLANSLLPALHENASRMIAGAGNLNLSARGAFYPERKVGNAEIEVESGYGNLSVLADIEDAAGLTGVKANIISDDFNLGKLLNQERVGILDFNLDADALVSTRIIPTIGNKDIQINKNPSASNIGVNITSGISAFLDMVKRGDVNISVNEAEINGYPLQGANMHLHKENNQTSIDAESNDENFNMLLTGLIETSGNDYTLSFTGDISKFQPSVAGLANAESDYMMAGAIDISVKGNFADPVNSIQGKIEGSDLYFSDLLKDKNILLSNLKINAAESDGERTYTIDSDWISGNLKGKFTPTHIPSIFKNLLSRSLPDIFPSSPDKETEVFDDVADFNFTIFRNGEWMEFLNSPVKLLYEATLEGHINAPESEIEVKLDAPYMQQGVNKLIQKTRLGALLKGESAKVGFYSAIPTKKGVLDLQGDIKSGAGLIDILLQFNPGYTGAFYGDLHLQGEMENALNAEGRNIKIKFLPSKIYLNGAEWNVDEATINCHNKIIDISNFSISHNQQYITINGIASQSLQDEVTVKLREIDLSYVFETLNIDVAQFGGIATGEAVGRALLSSGLEAFTRNLHVEDLSYNSVVLGDGELRGDFDISQKRVGIYADIFENKRFAARVDGGIWIGKDSLSFDFYADKVRLGFLQYYMKAFASKVEGRASGRALLYGTFKDVNMKARMKADSIAIKVDYTNVTYSGSDSVKIDPGYIRISDFVLHDDYGHTAKLNGVLKHNYFHNPEFDFRISDARGLLLYDTNESMNSVWYGRIFGSGGGRISGNDDFVNIEADMTAEGNSTFTFVLDDHQEAADYRFLKFTDKEKALRESLMPKIINEPDEIVRSFQNKVREQEATTSIFSMDIRATLTPYVKMVLVMDPEAGDKITARGSGPVNISYNSGSDEMKMFGKYTIDEGVYNFSLQDLILKDFIIKEGSSVSFNGDPMQAILNIRGAYRVNTNLTDLDMSFATDKDLNRVNVPVDAMLLVSGEMEHPDIKFDIELPTLNGETEQKVRSIISSEDMMNTQMIYLLALNRFYTPEYASGGNSNSGGEWASVASSTLSSQLSNILGQMTDKVTITPSLRSDKGDFSDLQVDVALSSRLFNNRLLINGNFGYRDRSTSSTTFIGDFDIEYLLNRSGNFRLKAYNHFNDQNYYLKSALTTQGIGVVWRKDFDWLFPRRRKKDSSENKQSIPADVSGMQQPDTISKK